MVGLRWAWWAYGGSVPHPRPHAWLALVGWCWCWWAGAGGPVPHPPRAFGWRGCCGCSPTTGTPPSLASKRSHHLLNKIPVPPECDLITCLPMNPAHPVSSEIKLPCPRTGSSHHPAALCPCIDCAESGSSPPPLGSIRLLCRRLGAGLIAEDTRVRLLLAGAVLERILRAVVGVRVRLR